MATTNRPPSPKRWRSLPVHGRQNETVHRNEWKSCTCITIERKIWLMYMLQCAPFPLPLLARQEFRGKSDGKRTFLGSIKKNIYSLPIFFLFSRLAPPKRTQTRAHRNGVGEGKSTYQFTTHFDFFLPASCFSSRKLQRRMMTTTTPGKENCTQKWIKK